MYTVVISTILLFPWSLLLAMFAGYVGTRLIRKH